MSITHLKFMECQINDSNFWKLCNYVPWVPDVFLALFGRRHERRKKKKTARTSFEDSKPETAHEKPLVPRVIIML